jgi:hypothetical protein
MEEIRMPEYEAPQVITYTDEEILDVLGMAQTGSGMDTFPQPEGADLGPFSI